MGRPLAHVPDPAGDGHASLRPPLRPGRSSTSFAGLGIHPDRYYWMSDIYPTGRDGPVHPARARPGRRRPRDLPPRGQRPASRRLASARRHLPELRQGRHDDRDRLGRRAGLLRVPARTSSTWARGCGSSRLDLRRSAARAKLPWNLEWAAQWSLFGVTIEPCGKDLSTAGGSRDRSDAIAREVFEREPPLNVPYEFLNIGGKKMSTSKGRGAAAHTIAEVIPPEQLRFLFLRPRPNQAIEFDPDGTDAIPRLFDEFDRFAAATGRPRGQGRAAAGLRGDLPLLAPRPDADVAAEAAAFRPAFAHLALLVQIPGVDVVGPGRGGEGEPADRARAARSSTSGSRRPRALARDLRARAGAARGPATSLPDEAGGPRRRPARVPRPRWPTPSDAAMPERRRRLAGRDLRRGAGLGLAAPDAPSRRSTSRSSAGRTARGPAGCWPASTRRSCIGRGSREAARRRRPAGGAA